MIEEKKVLKLESGLEKNKPKSRWKLYGLVGSTIILAVIAVLSAIKLYQLREEPVAPNAPKKVPAVFEETTRDIPSCRLEFAIPTLTPTDTPTQTPTLTPTGTMIPTDTPTETPTLTPTNTPTGSPTRTPTQLPTSKPTDAIAKGPSPTKAELPEAGVNFPVQVMIIIGSIITLSGLLIWL